jgi:putative MFS transporter
MLNSIPSPDQTTICLSFPYKINIYTAFIIRPNKVVISGKSLIFFVKKFIIPIIAGIITNNSAEPYTEKKEKPLKAGISNLLSKAFLRRTLTLWILWFGINFGYYGFVLWIPTLLVGKGFSLVRGFEFTLIMSLAQLPGYYSAAYLIERIGRKAVLVVYLAGTALAAYLYGQAADLTSVLVFGCLLYFFSLGAWGAVYAYTPEVYPTKARGSGSGWAAAVGRIGAIIAPYIVGYVYETKGKQAGFTYVFLMLTIVFAVVAVVIAVAGIETKGLTLEEINTSSKIN